MAKNSRILIIPDLHIPFHHKDAFSFLDAVNEKYKPDLVICLGDEIDGNQISFHDKDPDIIFSPTTELEESIWHLKDLYTIFPKVKVIDSNHGSLIYRRAKFAGLPASVIKPLKEVLDAPKGWSWTYDLTIKMSNGQDLYCHHGLNTDALKASQSRAMNYCQGHYHTKFEIRYWANSKDLYWGMTAGCLIDNQEIAFAYAKTTLPKPILGCAMVIDGMPKLIPMRLNKNNKWDKKVL